jgi:hypothetical protein
MKVLLRRPLRKSIFKDYCALPIYEIGPIDGETYWEGAIIDFAKPGERLDLEETHTFGAFIHLGTSQTYTEEDEATNSDKWRAYVATAAAVWVETTRFEDACDVVSNEYTEEYTAIHVAPGIVDQWFDTTTNELVVRIGFGVYCILKAPENAFPDDHYIEPHGVNLMVNGSALDWRFKAQLDASKNGALFEDTLEDLWATPKLAASTALWVAAWAYPPASQLFSTLGGIILLSNWAQTLSGRYIQHRGVTEKDTMVWFQYEPNVMRTFNGGYRHDEIQSLIFVDVYIPKEEIADWRVIPFDFTVGISTYDMLNVKVHKGVSLIVWLEDSDEVSVFFDDFEDGIGDWSAEDKNPASGLDYWGISEHRCTQTAWCAQVGYNEVRGKDNTEVWEYDKNMEAWLTHAVDLRPYQWANLSYFVDFDLRNDGDDVLELYFKVGDTWHYLDKRYTNHWTTFWDWVLVPTDASEIGFRFYSDNDNNIDLGIFLDNIGIRGKLHNDAPYQNTDAESFVNPNTITVGETWVNYAGYLGVLDDTEDWYKFTANPGRLIEVKLTSPSPADFKLELYDQNGTKKTGPTDTIRYTPSEDEGSCWQIKICTYSGSGQYDFDIRVTEAQCSMKTMTDGDFYVPIVASDVLKIRFLFDDAVNLTGDQIDYDDDYPVVDIKDMLFISSHYGDSEGEADWDYMADVYPDGFADIQDILAAALHYGNTGTYITDLTGVTVKFNTGEVLLPENGYVTIPQNAANFTVKQNGNPIGAMISFW